MSTLLGFTLPFLLTAARADVCQDGLTTSNPNSSPKIERAALLERLTKSGRKLRVLRGTVNDVERTVVLLEKVNTPAGTEDEADLQRAFSRRARQGPNSFIGFWFADSVRELSKWAEELPSPGASDASSIDLLADYRPSLFNRLHAAAWVTAKYSWVPSDSLTYAYAVGALSGVIFPSPLANLVNAAVFAITGMQSFACYGWSYGYTLGVLALGRKNRHMARTIRAMFEADPALTEFLAVVNVDPDSHVDHVAGVARKLWWHGFRVEPEFSASGDH